MYPDLYLPDVMNRWLSQKMYRKAEHLTPDGNPAAILEMKNLTLRYSTHTHAINRVNGKVYAIKVREWILIPGKICPCDL